jgi:sialic acid synthase SpsE
MKRTFGHKIGYSDPFPGFEINIGAIAMGTDVTKNLNT